MPDSNTMPTNTITTPALREYQQQGVDALRAAFRAGKRAPLYSLPTGGGKTVVFSHVTKASVAKGNNVLILVHRAELLRQTSRTLTAWGVPHGMIAPGYPMTAQRVQIASVQTAVRRLARMMPPDLIIIDEAHHAVAGTWQKIVEEFPAARLFGVTATPARLDGRGLGRHAGGYFDEMIQGPRINELIEAGHLARPRVFVARERVQDAVANVRTVAGDYNIRQLSDAVSTTAIIGDAVSHYRRLCPGTPAIAFCCTLDHAAAVCASFIAGGFRAAQIDGTMNDEQRKAIVSDLEQGRLDVMVSVDLVSEGFDVPVCGAAILMRPTKSEGLYLQQIGRALRKYPGKEHAFILDHAGNVAVHGLPQDDREWSLDGRTRRERDTTPSPIMCAHCYAMNPAGSEVCAECGQPLRQQRGPREIEERDGTLVELTAEQIERLRIRRERRIEEGRARTRPELEAIARARGYSMGWVNHRLAARSRSSH
jgi:superfamily II DNA or RNA helicase